jgi:hypothetical protein
MRYWLGAHRERRTISGFILNSVLNRIANQNTLAETWRSERRRGRKARAATA